MPKRYKRNCDSCNIFYDSPNGRFCSRRCLFTYKKSHPIPTSKATKILISKANRAENNGNWVGNKIGYNGLHTWVKRYFKKYKLCNHCKKVPPYDLANKGTYDRDFKNWEWLCRRCHMIKDGRMNNLVQFNEKRKAL